MGVINYSHIYIIFLLIIKSILVSDRDFDQDLKSGIEVFESLDVRQKGKIDSFQIVEDDPMSIYL